MDASDFRVFLLIFLFSLTYCGEPDLYDAVIGKLNERNTTTQENIK